MEETTNATVMTTGEALITAGFRKRSNHENTDMYKMFSILYGLIVFIGGVVFSISPAIVSGEEAEVIKHPTAIYFTCLYWISIIWMIYCMIDIIRHQKRIKVPADSNYTNLIGDIKRNKRISTSSEVNKQSSITPEIHLQLLDDLEEDQSDESSEINHSKPSTDNDHHRKAKSLDNLEHRSSVTKSPTDTTREVATRNSLARRRALDPTGKQHLRTYIRRRKNSIVQHVIGYNYDDNSTAGGLYTRVGIGIFCLGTLIHSSLSILSNLENRSCVRWTALMDDLSRLLFSLIQFFFIFKNSNLIIRAHESLARLGVIHVVVTNLCVWFRMVVIETKSEIVEVNDHEMAIAQHSNMASHLNNGSQDAIKILHHLLMSDSKCSKLVANGLPVTTFIHEGYMKLKPLLYPCTIEFSLMCLTMFFLIWENIGKTFSYKISDKASTKNVFMLNCHKSIKGLFAGMIVFSYTMISIILYAVFRHKTDDNTHMTSSLLAETAHGRSHGNLTSATIISHRQHSLSKTSSRIDYGMAILELLNLVLLTLSLYATIWSLYKIRKLNYRRTTTRFDDVLIIISLTGIYLYTIFSAFAIISNLSSSTWIAYVKVAIVILEFVEGTVQALFILIALRKRMRRTDKYEYPAREMITLLIMLDLSLWFEETTTTTKHEANPFQLAFYHGIPWSIIAAISTPLQIFFRFHASVCLSHIWANMYHWPPYQLVAHRN